jgi:lactoylglutathione lyase/glyoxylase I family protein
VVGFYLQVSDHSYVEVFQHDAIDLKAKSPILHFCLEVDDIEAAGRRLTENGYEATAKKLGADQSWQLWTADPSGVRIEFHQYTAHSTQLTHANCILE